MRWYVRAPTYAELAVFRGRVQACFEYVPAVCARHSSSLRVCRAAALATACRLSIKLERPYYDTRQNSVLGKRAAGLLRSAHPFGPAQRANSATSPPSGTA